MKIDKLALQERLSITPQILFHTLGELRDRHISIDDDELWMSVSKDPEMLHKKKLSFLQSQQLILKAIELSSDPELGFAVGLRQKFSSLTPMNSIMLASKSLRQALEMGGRYHRLVGSMIEVELQNLPGEMLKICIRPRFLGAPARRFLIQEALAVISIAILFLSDIEKPIVRICTPYLPDNLKRVKDKLRCSIEYDVAEHSIWIRKDVLDAPNPQSDTFAFRHTELILNDLLQYENDECPIMQWVESRIITTLPQIEDLSEVANALGISERTLRRKLLEEGTSYRELLKQVRIQWAEQMMMEGAASKEQIAYAVGFDDARSLRRLLNESSPSTTNRSSPK